MKTYTNGQRKGMMYGGAAKRKPMMYGGMATKKPRKKAQAGGMMTATQPQQNMMQNQAMQQPMMKMAKGGKFPDLTGDGEVTQADILKGRGVFNKGGRAYGKNEMGMINARLGHAVESLISNTDSDKPDSKLTKDSIKMYVNDIKLAVETGIAEAAGFSDAKIKQALRRATK